MITETLVFGMAVLAVGLVVGSAPPSNAHSRNGSFPGRLSEVQGNPDHVSFREITGMLEEAGLRDQDVRLIMAKVRELHIRPFTMFMWLMRYDAPALAIVVAADLSATELLTHLRQGSLPDLDGLRVSGGRNGLPAA